MVEVRAQKRVGEVWGELGIFRLLIWVTASRVCLRYKNLLDTYSFHFVCSASVEGSKGKPSEQSAAGVWLQVLTAHLGGQKRIAVVPILSAATVFWSLNKAVFAERCWLDFALSWILFSFGDKERFNNWCGRVSWSAGVCAEWCSPICCWIRRIMVPREEGWWRASRILGAWVGLWLV